VTSTLDPTRAVLEQLLDMTGETVARKFLAEVARPAARAEFERIVALRLAIRLREAQEPRHVIRDRLALRGLSRATAYRVIGRAISVPPVNCLTDNAPLRLPADTVQLHIDLDTRRPQPQETTTTMNSTPAMRVEITHLRAPWPADSGIGSIVEIPGDVLPGPFVGKCRPAQPNAKVTHVYEPPQRAREVDFAEDDPLGALDLPSANVDALVARRDDLRLRLRSIDLAAAGRRLEEAMARQAASPGDVPPTNPPGAGSSPEMNQRRIAYEAAAIELKAAQGSLRALREEALAITNELAYLSTLIEAEARVDAARATAQEAVQQAGLCNEAVVKAEAAMTHIESLIGEAEQAHQAALDEAGARVLEAVKAGNAVPVKAASRSRIETLEVAVRGAEQELEAARAASEQAEQRRRDAWQQVRLAESAVAERAFRQAEREYVEALARVMAAKSLARDPFGAIDPRSEAIVRSRHIVEALGA
jgi:hypothetical protein